MSTAMAVNAHTHIYSGLAPLGIPLPAEQPPDFVGILEQVWWKLDRALDESSLRASAELYVAEALALGCTGLIDHHESPDFISGSLDVLADVCQELGMPAVLCYGATERNHGRDEARAGLAECARFARDNRRPLVRTAVGLHASFTVSDETITEAVELARGIGSVLHVHVAEDGADVRDARERGYAGVVDRFVKLGAMVPGSIFAHGVHLTADEVGTCDERGVWLVQNPRSNRGNRVGYPSALAASAHVALGTDGYPANMADEQAALMEVARAAGDDLERAAARAACGQVLLAERFAGRIPAVDPKARERAAAMIANIRERARVPAEKLWQRMRQL